MKWLRRPKKRTIVLIVILMLVLVLRTAAVNIGLLPRSQTEILYSFYINRNAFEQYVTKSKDFVKESDIRNFSVWFYEYDGEMEMSFSALDKGDVVKSALGADAEDMYKNVMPFKEIGTSKSYGDRMQVYFKLRGQRGIIYTEDGKTPEGQVIVYTRHITDNWYYFKEDVRGYLKSAKEP